MNCTHARRLFAACWDDEITQAEREWLEGHFVGCALCRTDYEQYSRALEALADLPRVEASPDLVERVLARARRARAAPDRIISGSLTWVPATAAAVALLLIGATLLSPWLPPVPRGSRGSRIAGTPPVRQPELVVPRVVPARPPYGSRTTPPSVTAGEADRVLANIPDSLFDHGDDVEFILDPVTLRRGRPAVNRRMPAVQGQQATITF